MTVEISISAPPIEPITSQLLNKANVSLNVLRLDLGHPLLSGNKWFKLKYNLEQFQRQRELPILSFGGAYSNHLHALAAAGKLLGMRTIGVLRGELVEPLNPVLRFAREQGMRLYPVSRSAYRRKEEDDFLAELRREFGDFHLLPEGGSNALAMKGCAEIAEALSWTAPASKNLLALCCGTGTTMAGLISGVSKFESPPSVLGISVLKGDGYLAAEVSRQLRGFKGLDVASWRVEDSYHCGGYARSNAELEAFLDYFKELSDIPIEPIYTGKLFYGLFDLIARGLIPAGTEVLAIHSGGIHEHSY